MMTLRIVRPVGKSGWPPRGCSVFYVDLERKHLSEPYRLRDGDLIVGKIIEVKHRWRDESYSEFENKKVRFRLLTSRSTPGLDKDMLFLVRDDWIDFREHGLVTSEYTLDVEFEKAIRNGQEIVLYSKRDKYLR